MGSQMSQTWQHESRYVETLPVHTRAAPLCQTFRAAPITLSLEGWTLAGHVWLILALVIWQILYGPFSTVPMPTQIVFSVMQSKRGREAIFGHVQYIHTIDTDYYNREFIHKRIPFQWPISDKRRFEVCISIFRDVCAVVLRPVPYIRTPFWHAWSTTERLIICKKRTFSIFDL